MVPFCLFSSSLMFLLLIPCEILHQHTRYLAARQDRSLAATCDIAFESRYPIFSSVYSSECMCLAVMSILITPQVHVSDVLI